MWAWIIRLIPVLTKGSPMLIAGVIGVLVGVWATHEYYEKREHKQALQHAIEKAEQGRKNYEKIIRISNELDSALRGADSLRSQYDRVRKLYDSTRAATRAQGVDAGAVARCEQLLREGAELATEGGSLLQSNALKHDALSDVIR